jgi:flagellar hook-associated protein 2
MAVSSSNSSSSSTSTASIDVSGIVQQLMTAENRPLETLKTKITQQQVVISDLGNIRSKVATFKDALTSFQSPTSYNNMRASTSDSAVVNATAANGSVAGSYSISVSQIAAASKHALSGYSSATMPINVDATDGFVITVGNTQFSTKGVVKVDGVVSARTVSSLAASPTVSTLATWINGLGSSVKAGVVQTTASDQWALTIEGTETGTAKAVTYTGLATGTVNPDATTVAKNAQFSINGIAFERSTNTVTDAVASLTINLLGTTAAGTSKTIAVSQGADTSEKKITDLVTAYNDLMALYKTLTANSANSDKPGTFATNPTMLGFIGDIKSRLATGFAYGVADPVTGQRPTMSLASLGMDLQRDGTIKFNSITHAMAVSNGLQSTLTKGVNLGYVSDSNTLLTFVTSAASFNGPLSKQIEAQNNSVIELRNRQDELETRLNVIQNGYINQYSALNALLFQLSSTSNSLTSALDALTNNNNNN